VRIANHTQIDYRSCTVSSGICIDGGVELAEFQSRTSSVFVRTSGRHSLG